MMIKNIIVDSLRTTAKVCILILKLIIPISIMMKIISELGLITYIGNALSPVMSVVGLPGSYALVWATGMLTNIYAALMVFSSVIAEEPLTAAQVSVLGIMILVAHALPIEASVARKIGNKTQNLTSYQMRVCTSIRYYTEPSFFFF